MPRLTIREAKEQGYTVDTTCYPHLGYKGPRFAPTEAVKVLTVREADLLAACETVLRYLSSHQIYDKDARGILERAVAKAHGEEQTSG